MKRSKRTELEDEDVLAAVSISVSIVTIKDQEDSDGSNDAAEDREDDVELQNDPVWIKSWRLI